MLYLALRFINQSSLYQVAENVNALLNIVDETSKLRLSKFIKRAVIAMSAGTSSRGQNIATTSHSC